MRRLLLTLAVLGFPVLAFAQGENPAPAGVDWNELVAYAVNTVVVFASVQLIKAYAGGLPVWVKQLLALAGGPLLMMFVQPTLSAALGHPIDLSPVAAVLTGLVSGLTAMATFDAAKLAGGQK